MKKTRSNGKNIIGSILVSFLIIALVVSVLFIKSYFLKKPRTVSSKNFSLYIHNIQTEGAAKSYADFKMANQRNTLSSQHTEAHVFGEALYQEKGLPGITTCDDSFNYGCFHSVIGNTLAYEGLGKINEINYYCLNQDQGGYPLKCQHGIGHGLVAFLGYDLQHLTQALDICNKLPGHDPIGGCFTGVFMEYNFETMLASDAKIRKFDNNNPIFPCNSLEASYQNPCIYEQSNWWLNVLPGRAETKMETIDSFCRQADSYLQENCYIGLGIHYPSAVGWDIKKSEAGCKTIAIVNSQALCLSGVVNEFIQRPDFTIQAQILCDSLPQTEKKLCRQKAGMGI